MSHYALWVSHENAVLFKYTAEGIEERPLKRHHTANHHHHHQNEVKHHEHEKFYHDLTHEMPDAEELLILGPGIAKDEFRHHCEKHHSHTLAKAIVGTEPSTSHPSKNELLEKASKFFKRYHLWTKNY